jgi:hypothetical protein
MRKIALLITVCLLTACSARLGSLTMMTTKNLGNTPKSFGQPVQGEECTHQILGIPVGSLNPGIQGAMDNALAKNTQANALIDVKINRELLFLYVYARNCIKVEGKAVAYSDKAS